MKRFWWRHLAPFGLVYTLKAGLGAFVGIGLIAFIAESSALPFLITSFGSTSAMLFLVPDSQMSQPANVIGGHMIAAAVGLVVDALLPGSWWAMALAVGGGVIAMGLARVMHPPAGANPLIVMFDHPGFDFLIVPVLFGTVALVVLAVFVHRLPPKPSVYPAPVPDAEPPTRS
jgi:CBS-domain-containing membrane protein